MSEKVDQVTVMIMLDRPVALDVSQLVAKVGDLLGIDQEPAPPTDGTSFVLPASGDLIIGMVIPAPIPQDAYQHAADTAYWWPEAFQVASRHQAHLIVSCAWRSDTRLTA